jgi:hypothetical protein
MGMMLSDGVSGAVCRESVVFWFIDGIVSFCFGFLPVDDCLYLKRDEVQLRAFSQTYSTKPGLVVVRNLWV